MNLKDTCEAVLAAGEKATARPWKHERIAHDPDQFSYEFFEGDFSFAIYEANYDKPMKAKFDADYVASSANNAERLAKACLLLMEAIDDSSLYYGDAPGIFDAVAKANALFDDRAEGGEK